VPAEKMPYVTPLKTRSGSAVAYDSGDFPRCVDMATQAIDYAGFAERQRRAREQGRFLGIGMGSGVKGTGRGPFESGIVRVGRSGRISVYWLAAPTHSPRNSRAERNRRLYLRLKAHFAQRSFR